MIVTTIPQSPADGSAPDPDQFLQGRDAGTVTLVIAHDDRDLIHSVRRACPHDDYALVPLDQQMWKQQLPNLISAATTAGVAGLVLVGHSRALSESIDGDIPDAAFGSGAGATLPSENSLLSQTRSAQRVMRLSRHQFGLLAGRLLGPLHESAHCTTECHALFYLADAGRFLRLDLSSGRFSPLL